MPRTPAGIHQIIGNATINNIAMLGISNRAKALTEEVFVKNPVYIFNPVVTETLMNKRLSIRYRLALVCLVCMALGDRDAQGTEIDAAVEAELHALLAKVPAFQVVALPVAPGEVVLGPEQSLTIDRLRNVDLDDDPPMLGQPAKPYDERMTDAYPPDDAPYVARGIRPFRLKHFNCEFNYGGWHNFAMADYAAAHGFRIIYPYTREIDQTGHLPAGTQWLGWGGFINWHKWFGDHQLPDGRYDLLMDKDLVQIHTREGKFALPEDSNSLKHRGDYLMIDMEHPVLSPKNLRQQSWYPQDAPEVEKNSFEKRYYDGYAQTYIAAVETARRQGWRNISLYGWAPYGRTWGGLEAPEVAPGTDHAWNMFGRQIYDVVDIVNNSVYCFYWSPQNVAFTLANIDSNMALVNSMPVKKPVRPYFWTLLHGGGGGWRWWKGQPLANEEKRAMIAMAFFTGIDGFDTWNWSGTGNHHVPSPLTQLAQNNDYFASGRDVMLKDGFQRFPDNSPSGGQPELFERYDVMHVLSIDEEKGLVRFQKIRHHEKNHGVTDDQPVFALPIEQLELHLRIKSEPVAAMIEGMALVKPLEYSLRQGEVKVDLPARRQFKQTLPIVRRVKLGPIHLLCTYDPKVLYGGEPREIALTDFDGCPGRTLRLPADSQTRIFVLREETN